MTYRSSTIALEEENSLIEVLGETGGTIVHVFPNGNARVKKGKKTGSTSPRHQSVQPQGRTTKAPKASASKSKPNGNLQAPPPPSLRPGCLAFGVKTYSDADNLSRANRTDSVDASSNHQKTSAKDLEDFLLKQNLVTAVQLEVARYDQSASSMSLEEILVARGWVTQDVIDQFQNS
ncbi:MAG: hypothetical protein AAFR31_04000 [Cyanobacteria bacterium J06627_8]